MFAINKKTMIEDPLKVVEVNEREVRYNSRSDWHVVNVRNNDKLRYAIIAHRFIDVVGFIFLLVLPNSTAGNWTGAILYLTLGLAMEHLKNLVLAKITVEEKIDDIAQDHQQRTYFPDMHVWDEESGKFKKGLSRWGIRVVTWVFCGVMMLALSMSFCVLFLLGLNL